MRTGFIGFFLIVIGTAFAGWPLRAEEAPAIDTGQRVRAETLVRELYNRYLGREPDPAGLAHYTGLLLAGQADERSMIHTFKKSPEYRSARKRIEVGAVSVILGLVVVAMAHHALQLSKKGSL